MTSPISLEKRTSVSTQTLKPQPFKGSDLSLRLWNNYCYRRDSAKLIPLALEPGAFQSARKKLGAHYGNVMCASPVRQKPFVILGAS